MGRFVQIAMGSGAEVSYHLLLSNDLQFLRHEQYIELAARVERVMKMLSVLSGKLRNVKSSVLSQKPTANSQQLSSSNLFPA
jgi:hypothetical protein